MLPTVILRVSKHIGDEATHFLLATIQNATIVDLVPFSWPQLQQCVPYLTTNKNLVTIIVNFKRMVKSASPSSYPAARNMKTMLSQLATVQAKETEIIWYADLDGHMLTVREKTLCRKAIDVKKACMTRKGTDVDRAWLAEYTPRYDEYGRSPTSWDDFCERIDVKADGWK